MQISLCCTEANKNKRRMLLLFRACERNITLSLQHIVTWIRLFQFETNEIRMLSLQLRRNTRWQACQNMLSHWFYNSISLEIKDGRNFCFIEVTKSTAKRSLCPRPSKCLRCVVFTNSTIRNSLCFALKAVSAGFRGFAKYCKGEKTSQLHWYRSWKPADTFSRTMGMFSSTLLSCFLGLISRVRRAAIRIPQSCSMDTCNFALRTRWSLHRFSSLHRSFRYYSILVWNKRRPCMTILLLYCFHAVSYIFRIQVRAVWQASFCCLDVTQKKLAKHGFFAHKWRLSCFSFLFPERGEQSSFLWWGLMSNTHGALFYTSDQLVPGSEMRKLLSLTWSFLKVHRSESAI